MSRAHDFDQLARSRREVFVTYSYAGQAEKPTGPCNVEIWFQALGANLVISMGAEDAEAVAEELVHVAAIARDINARRRNAKAEKC